MNAISSAAPCHVLVNWKADRSPSRHDVIVWTLDDYQTPIPYFLVDGELMSIDDVRRLTYKVTAATLCSGTAASMATGFGLGR